MLIDADTATVNDLIQREQLPFGIRNRVLLQFPNNGTLGLDDKRTYPLYRTWMLGISMNF